MDVQSLAELADVRSAAKATVAAVMAGIRAIRPGVSQRSVEVAVEDACWKQGAHGSSFWPWAMAGINGVFPKPFTSMTLYDHLNGIMNAGDLVRLDVGCEWNYYGGDLGRTCRCRAVTAPISARSGTSLSPHIMRAQNRCGREPPRIRSLRAWRSELLRQRQSARSSLAKQAIEEWSKREKVRYWQIHTINLDEGRVGGPLRAGTTIAFEPITSIGGQGYYLEDMFLVTKEGAELLTPGRPLFRGRNRSRDASLGHRRSEPPCVSMRFCWVQPANPHA